MKEVKSALEPHSLQWFFHPPSSPFPDHLSAWKPQEDLRAYLRQSCYTRLRDGVLLSKVWENLQDDYKGRARLSEFVSSGLRCD